MDCDEDALYDIIQDGVTVEQVNERDRSGRVSNITYGSILLRSGSVSSIIYVTILLRSGRVSNIIYVSLPL